MTNQISKAREALVRLGDNSTLPDIERNALEQTIRQLFDTLSTVDAGRLLEYTAEGSYICVKTILYDAVKNDNQRQFAFIHLNELFQAARTLHGIIGEKI